MAPNLDPVGAFSILQSNRKFFYIYTVRKVIHESRSLIGTVEIAKFGPVEQNNATQLARRDNKAS